MSDLSNTELAKKVGAFRALARQKHNRAVEAEGRLDAVTRERDEAYNRCSTCGEMSGGGAYGCEECTEFLSEAELTHRADLEAVEADRDRLLTTLETVRSWRDLQAIYRHIDAALASPQPAERAPADATPFDAPKMQQIGTTNLGDQLAHHRQKVVDIERKLRA